MPEHPHPKGGGCKIVACDHLCGSVVALLAERFVRDDIIIGPVVLLIANAHTESSQLYCVPTGLSTFESILCSHSIEYDLLRFILQIDSKTDCLEDAERIRPGSWF